MNYKAFLQKLGFLAQDQTDDIFSKKYADTLIKVDFQKQKIDYGEIKSESETTQNFSQEENGVVLECVNRLLEKGYQAKDITLEKVFPSGHGHSGRLDIFVEKEGKAFLMIECKTWGKEFEKEEKNTRKDGGQLFTYFQQNTKTDFLVLYTSKFDEKSSQIEYKNRIIKIEEHYREDGSVEDFYDRWNKVLDDNGIFEEWVSVYNFKNKELTSKDLKPLSEEDSHFVFHEFLSILRKHSVSDKPNAFNKIFNLFLSKIFDEKKGENKSLEFQWIEGKDDAVEFQIRLINLHKQGLFAFLKKEIEGISDSDFSYKNDEELKEKKKKLLKFNKIFDIKDVNDDESFEDNQRILKEIVQLLQGYKLRYPRKQRHLSDFFELLLTTGLKQESGQFFTPPTIAKFIVRSVPFLNKIKNYLENNEIPKLPSMIDYSAGSGHFLTEAMEEMQEIIDDENLVDFEKLYPDAIKKVKVWREDKYDWAKEYIYGIEKDDRLVKVAKVGCYFYGDGLAQVINGDGLDSFTESKSYRGLLKQKENEKSVDNPRFDFVLSNPPYSVSSFRRNIGRGKTAENDFELWKFLTDQSSEIEALFIERTKQLLKEDGIAGIILPSSILSNSGIYTKAREIILKYFEIVAITELGSNTFMATGTNTVILFLKRRGNYYFENLFSRVKRNFNDKKDVTISFDKFEEQKPFVKYLNYVWSEEETIDFEDYLTLMNKNPNDKIRKHDIFQEYEKKIKAKNEAEKWEKILELEQEKIAYFLLASKQKVVLVKTGEKNEEKRFLGYEFSNRRGSEGIHAIKRGKSIDECTSLFDSEDFYNPEKASTYILEAFEKKEEREISEEMKNNVFRVDLVDMMNFGRFNFEKTINLKAKKKQKIESQWRLVKLGDICDLYQPKTITSQEIMQSGNYKVFGANGVIGFYNKYNHEDSEIAMTCRGATCGTINFTEPKSWITGNAMVIKPIDSKILNQKYIFHVLKDADLSSIITGTAQPQITRTTLSPFKIPLPPLEIQEKIVKEIEDLEKKEEKLFSQIEKLEKGIGKVLKSSKETISIKLGDVLSLEYGSALNEKDRIDGEFPVVGSNGIIGYHNNFFVEGPSIIVGRKGSAGKVTWIEKNNCPIDTTFYVKNVAGKTAYKFLFYVLKDIDLESLVVGSGVPGLNRNDVYDKIYNFPLLPEQQKIITEIEEIENQISKLNEELEGLKSEKESVLKSYL